MLVMTTIFISKMEGLPPTSATKMIDIWLILCQLVPFAQVVLLTAIEYLREEELDEKEEKEDCDKSTAVTDEITETKRALNLFKEKSKITSVSMLTVIGRF